MKKSLIPVFLMAFAVSAVCQNSLPLKKVSIFKNTTSMIVKEGTLQNNNGQFVLPIPGQVLFGTYWLGSNKENNLKSITFKTDTLKKISEAKNISQLIVSNIGKQVSVINYKSEKISGKITGFLNAGEIAKIKADNGKTVYAEVRNLVQIEFTDDNNSSMQSDTITRFISIQPEKKSESLNLQECYLQLGFNWIPSYLLKLTNDKDARLEMKATVENYSENLNDVETELVVGSPQVYFGLRQDPLTYNYVTSNSGSYGTTARWDNNAMRNDMSNMMQVQTATTSIGDGRYGYIESDFETEGEKNNDLYYYNLGKISLEKNSKGNFPVFSIALEYKNKYEANIPDKVNYSSYQYCDNSETNYDVFHSVEFKNSSKFPFTTAPVMVIADKSQFLAQDLLKYTPTGATTTVKLSKAIDILLKNSEEEINRADNVKKIARTSYSKVILKGTVHIENHQQKAVTIEIVKNINGTATNAGGATFKKVKAYNNVNPAGELKWEITMNAGEKKQLNYEYEVYFVAGY